MGSADRPLLRGVPAGVSDLRRVDAPYCLHPRWRRGEGGTGAHWADCHAPRITLARGPSLWDDCDAPMGQDVDAVQEWDEGTGGTRLRHRSAHKLVNSKAAMMTRLGGVPALVADSATQTLRCRWVYWSPSCQTWHHRVQCTGYYGL